MVLFDGHRTSTPPQEAVMTQQAVVPSSPRPTKPPVARGRRVKRGVVAGYLHGLSPRHRVEEPVGARAAKSARDRDDVA
jgi:hypothetical protein